MSMTKSPIITRIIANKQKHLLKYINDFLDEQ